MVKIIILSNEPEASVSKSTGEVNVKEVVEGSPTRLFGFMIKAGTFVELIVISLETNK